ncbi:MAG: M1 family metallopeptidase [Rhodothermales bacterium]
MNRLLLLFGLLALTVASATADPYPRNPHVDVLHYTFRLTLSDQTDEIRGETTVTVRFLADGLASFDLDLIETTEDNKGMTVTAVTMDGHAVAFTHENDRLHLPLSSPSKAQEQRTYAIAYRGIPADGLYISENRHGERTFFGDNWPDRARHWLPTVDHPSDKAFCEFVVTAPNRYQVVGSGLLVEETDLPGGLRLTHWRGTVPMATKVMVIGVARFAVQHVDEYQGTPIQSWVYPQDREAGFYDYALAERILQFFSGHIGPFPYAKLANVQSKTRFGGMENASNIFYSERSVSGTRRSEGLMAHEIAHQWFGDSVTEADWHHIWLSEGFATYFTQLYMEYTYGRDRLVAGMRAGKSAVLNRFEQAPSSAIVDTTITNLFDLLNANSYRKGGWVLHMLRYIVGNEAFWDGIRAYYHQYRDGNALTEDFQRVMETVSGQDLSWFFQQWIYQPGQPRYEGTWHYDAAAGQLTVTLNQMQTNGTFFRMPVELGIYTDDASLPRIEVMNVDQAQNTFTFVLDTPPTTVVLDPNTWVLMEATFSPR